MLKLLVIFWTFHWSGANILQNPGFESTENDIPTSWCHGRCCTCFGLKASKDRPHSGSNSVLASNRTYSWLGPSQDIGEGHENKLYRVSAFVRLGNVDPKVSARIIIRAHFRIDGISQYPALAQASANSDSWSQALNLYRFPPEATGRVQVYVETTYNVRPYYDFYVDDIVMVEHVPTNDWREKTDSDIRRYRSRPVTLHLTNIPTESVEGNIRQTRKAFPFGSAVNMNLVWNDVYRKTFFDNFNHAVIENDMKWTQNERIRNIVDFSAADSILEYLEERGIPCRAHTLFWAVEGFVQDWVKALDRYELMGEMKERVNDAINHFRGRVISWDVNNEMQHGRYFRDALSNDSIPTWMFTEIRKHDSSVPLFLNDYNLITNGAAIEGLLQHAKRITDEGGNIGGVGAQGHFIDSVPDYDYLRLRLDLLSSLGLPVWISELDVHDSNPVTRAEKLELIIRTCYSHPAVKGIMLWGFWANSHWGGPDASLWNVDWSTNEAGATWQRLMREWSTELTVNDVVDAGSLQRRFDAFHGDYELEIDGVIYPFQVPEGSEELYIEIDVSDSSVSLFPEASSSVPPVGITSTTSPSKQQLLRNPDFEDWTGGLPNDWCEQTCLTCMQFIGTCRSWSGNFAVLVASRTASYYGPTQIVGSGFNGQKFEVSGHFRLHGVANDVERRIEIMITYKQEGESRYISAAQTQANSTHWSHALGRFQIPDDVKGQVRLYIQTEYQKEPFVDFMSDNMSLRRVDGQGFDRIRSRILS